MKAMLAILATTSLAHAQVFPSDAAYTTLLCEGAPMNDLYNDESGAIDERDIVGDAIHPAGMRAVDATHLYMRMRLDDDPAPGGQLRPFAWGFEIDLDGVLSTYELLLHVDGTGGGQGQVAVYSNTTTTLPNDPADPPDQPAKATFPTAMNARSVPAAGSSFGGSPDFWIEIAVPWSALEPLGFDRDQRIFVWGASSSTSMGLNGDFACHDGSSGDPKLDEVVSDPTAGDPVIDSDGDGFSDAEEIEAGSDPNDPESVPSASRLEGGGGCSAGGSGGLGLLLLLAIRAGRFDRRARRRSDGGPRTCRA